MRPNIPPHEFAKWLKSLPEEKRKAVNEEERRQADLDYKEFVEIFNNDLCSLCGKPLASFNEKSPCLHWLLRPKKFKKKHLPLLTESFSYFRISAYVRWVASIEAPLRNINDLLEEHPGEKIIDFTAKFKHITWSFSCGQSDLEGHKNTRHGSQPHYHMQIFLQGNPFISYSDFHIPFHPSDLYDLELLIKHSDIARHDFGKGSGMQEILGNEELLEQVIDSSDSTKKPEEAAFKLDTIIMAKEGETLSGDMLAEAFKEAERTGKTATSVLKDRLKDTGANIRTIVSPGEGVPKALQRKGGRKKKS